MRELFIFGGANGSGKTTMAKEFCSAFSLPFINADEIAAGMGGQYDGNRDIMASRTFLDNMRSSIQSGASFVIENTLSCKTLVKHIIKAKEHGYAVVLFYIYLDNSELAISRVRTRYAKGGHLIQPDVIRRRMQRSLCNFHKVYSTACDRWYIYYNGGVEAVCVAENNKNLVIYEPKKYYDFIRRYDDC